MRQLCAILRHFLAEQIGDYPEQYDNGAHAGQESAHATEESFSCGHLWSEDSCESIYLLLAINSY